MIENTSGIIPLGRAVLVKPVEEQLSSVIAIPDSVSDRQVMMDTKMLVLAVGPEAWKEEKEPRALPGDVVLVSKFAGHIAKGDDGRSYRLINAADIFAGVRQ